MQTVHFVMTSTHSQVEAYSAASAAFAPLSVSLLLLLLLQHLVLLPPFCLPFLCAIAVLQLHNMTSNLPSRHLAAAPLLQQRQHRTMMRTCSVTAAAALGRLPRSCAHAASLHPLRMPAAALQHRQQQWHHHLRRRLAPTAVLPPLAMVNVDFASPSLVLGVTLIGCGIALLQVGV